MENKCPKCGSSNTHIDKKGYSVKKGALGWFITGGVGLIGGLIGANKIEITCLDCGHKFKPGQGCISVPNIKIESLPSEQDNLGEYQRLTAEHLSRRGVKRPIARTTIYQPAQRINQKVTLTCTKKTLQILT